MARVACLASVDARQVSAGWAVPLGRSTMLVLAVVYTLKFRKKFTVNGIGHIEIQSLVNLIPNSVKLRKCDTI